MATYTAATTTTFYSYGTTSSDYIQPPPTPPRPIDAIIKSGEVTATEYARIPAGPKKDFDRRYMLLYKDVNRGLYTFRPRVDEGL